MRVAVALPALASSLMAALALAGCSPPPVNTDAGADASLCPNNPAEPDQPCAVPVGTRCASTFAQDCTGAFVRVYCSCAASGRWACEAPPCDAGREGDATATADAAVDAQPDGPVGD